MWLARFVHELEGRSSFQIYANSLNDAGMNCFARISYAVLEYD